MYQILKWNEDNQIFWTQICTGVEIREVTLKRESVQGKGINNILYFSIYQKMLLFSIRKSNLVSLDFINWLKFSSSNYAKRHIQENVIQASLSQL